MKNLKKIIYLIFFIGLIFVIIEVTKVITLKSAPKPVIKYKYVPRTFQQEQDNPIPIFDIFDDMFQNPSPWIGSFNLYETQRPLRDDPRNPSQGFVSQNQDYLTTVPQLPRKGLNNFTSGGKIVGQATNLVTG